MAKAAVQTALENVSTPMLPEEPPAASPTGETTNNFDVATIAYQLWEDRGRPEGDPDKDWYEAERQINARISG